MRILAWLIAALIFGAVGIESVGSMFVALGCLSVAVWEMSKQEKKE